MTALRRAIGTVRYVNDELGRASEAIIRSARAPQPPPQVGSPASGASVPASGSGAPAGSPAHAAVAADRPDQAA
jgi:hypothetical protein